MNKNYRKTATEHFSYDESNSNITVYNWIIDNILLQEEVFTHESYFRLSKDWNNDTLIEEKILTEKEFHRWLKLLVFL